MANQWSCFFCKHCQLNNFTVDTKRTIEFGAERLMCKRFWCDHFKSYRNDVAIEPSYKGGPVPSAKTVLSERGCGNFEKREDEKPHYEQLDLFEMQHQNEKEKEEA